MSERIVSPGVFTRENDLSFLAQGVGEIGAAFIGPFKQGPAFIPTIVRTNSEFQEIFGTPDGTYYTEYAVQNYLREAGVATIVRVGGVGGYTHSAPAAIFASGSDGRDVLIATLHSTTVGDTEDVGFPASTNEITTGTLSGSFTLSGSELGVSNLSVSILPSSNVDVRDVFGTSPFGPRNAYVYSYFESSSLFFGTAASETVIRYVELPTQDFGYDIQHAYTPYVQSQEISGTRYNLFRFHTIGDGGVYNTKFKVGISNVKAAGEVGGTDFATFTVSIRRFDDIDRRKVVLETFNNVNLDPASPNYIARVIGDRYYEIDNLGKITEFGDFSNNSKYVRVEVVSEGSFPIVAAPFGHEAYYLPIKTDGLDTKVPVVKFQTRSSENNPSSPINFSGFDFEEANNKVENLNYLKPIPDGATVGANVSFGFEVLGYEMTGSDATDMVKRQFLLAFQHGFDGVSPTVPNVKGVDISAGNSQGFNLATSTSSGSIAYSKAINAVSNGDEWDINMVVTPGIIRRLHPSVTQTVIDMVEAREDAFYIADFNGANDTIGQATDQANSVDTNYVATYYPWVKTIDTNTNKLLSVPPSVLLPAVYASNDRLAAEWFAPAGLNRGGITGAVSVLNRLTHSERDTLYENKVNPIAAFPGQGIVAFGQKTLQDRPSALDRINVRRLLINLKKFVASTSRFLVFEQNTSTTRNRFINTVNPYLESVQQRQGLFAFRVVMDESNNTPDVIDRNILAGQLFLQPAKTAEFIVIDFNILPTGATFGD
jgi:hypothetical protein